MSLTPRQQRFVEEYLVDLNATQAAIRAGYEERSAHVTGARLLKNAKVAAAVQAAQKARSQRTEITQDRVLRELEALGFSNMLDYVEVQPDGSAYVDLRNLTREQAAAIQEITVDEYQDGFGDDARPVKRVRVKLVDKKSTLELIGKHLGMFPARVDLNARGRVAFDVVVVRTQDDDRDADED